jgi:hypothetical protein
MRVLFNLPHLPLVWGKYSTTSIKKIVENRWQARHQGANRSWGAWEIIFRISPSALHMVLKYVKAPANITFLNDYGGSD